MYYNQTILNSDRYSLYITIIKSDNNMTTEALKHYKGEWHNVISRMTRKS